MNWRRHFLLFLFWEMSKETTYMTFRATEAAIELKITQCCEKIPDLLDMISWLYSLFLNFISAGVSIRRLFRFFFVCYDKCQNVKRYPIATIWKLFDNWSGKLFAISMRQIKTDLQNCNLWRLQVKSLWISLIEFAMSKWRKVFQLK